MNPRADLVWAVISVGSSVALLFVAWIWGSAVERAHFTSLRRREARFRELKLLTIRALPEGRPILDTGLVQGSVVISIDYFKAFVAGIRVLFGGPVRSFEPLMERARREALQRLREHARKAGFDTVVGVRLDTATIAGRFNSEGCAGVEVVAYGTGIRSR